MKKDRFSLVSATMLYTKPSSAATALHRKGGIIRGDFTGGRAMPSAANAPTLTHRNAAGAKKISMAQRIATCTNLAPSNTMDHATMANFSTTRRSDLLAPRPTLPSKFSSDKRAPTFVNQLFTASQQAASNNGEQRRAPTGGPKPQNLLRPLGRTASARTSIPPAPPGSVAARSAVPIPPPSPLLGGRTAMGLTRRAPTARGQSAAGRRADVRHAQAVFQRRARLGLAARHEH